MWTFVAKYDNMDTGDSAERTISFDGDNAGMAEQECFHYALSEAFNKQANNECLVSIEFISC